MSSLVARYELLVGFCEIQGPFGSRDLSLVHLVPQTRRCMMTLTGISGMKASATPSTLILLTRKVLPIAIVTE